MAAAAAAEGEAWAGGAGLGQVPLYSGAPSGVSDAALALLTSSLVDTYTQVSGGGREGRGGRGWV